MPTLLVSLKTSSFSNLSVIVITLSSSKHKSTIFSPKVSNKSICPFLRIDLISSTMCSYETKFSILCSIPEILSFTSKDNDIEISTLNRLLENWGCAIESINYRILSTIR